MFLKYEYCVVLLKTDFFWKRIFFVLCYFQAFAFFCFCFLFGCFSKISTYFSTSTLFCRNVLWTSKPEFPSVWREKIMTELTCWGELFLFKTTDIMSYNPFITCNNKNHIIKTTFGLYLDVRCDVCDTNCHSNERKRIFTAKQPRKCENCDCMSVLKTITSWFLNRFQSRFLQRCALLGCLFCGIFGVNCSFMWPDHTHLTQAVVELRDKK